MLSNMADQTDLSNISNEARAQNLVRVVERFISTFNERAGEEAAAEVILDKKKLWGGHINQEPERFIEDELIEPTMSVLGYECRFRPKGFDGLEGRIPDFTALNLSSTNFGEVKVPGDIQNARKESFEYQEMATDRPLVGFSTDGFTWILHTAVSEDDDPQYRNHVTLHELMRKIRIEQSQSKAERRDRRHLRDLAIKFVSEFNIDAVETANKC